MKTKLIMVINRKSNLHVIIMNCGSHLPVLISIVLLTFLLSPFSFFPSPCYAQVPQGFNYQAIARDASGNPITNHSLPVRITIQSDSLGGTTFWIEEHSSVTTNSFGLFTLILGKGVRQTGSTLLTFSDINWSVTPKFIKTEIDYSGWKDMGSSRLWAVPYSMVAGDLNDTLKKLVVKGKTDAMDEALFEVKNKNGQTVFAVYNEGVRIYVDNGVGKSSTKGGFAIGGFDEAKTGSQNFFVVSPDSIRAYLNPNPVGKGVTKGGFAIGGFDQVKTGLPQKYFYINDDSIRMYIDNTTGKSSTKGGFAIGGFDAFKGSRQKLLTVSNDSIRMYINDIPGKSSTKGGFAIGGFSEDKGLKSGFLNVTPDSTRIYVNEPASTLSKNGFAVRGWNQTSNSAGDILNLGRFGSKLYSKANYITDEEYTSWNLQLIMDGKPDTIKLLKASLGKLSMTIPYNSATKGYDPAFEVKTSGGVFKGGLENIVKISYKNMVLGNGSTGSITGQNNILFGNTNHTNSASLFCGDENIILGYYSATYGDILFGCTETDNNNVLIGSGMKVTGNNNVCIGYNAGSSRINGESNKLYIANSNVDNTGALIYGEFDNRKLVFNADVVIGASFQGANFQVINPNPSLPPTIVFGSRTTGSTNMVLGTSDISNGYSSIQSVKSQGSTMGDLILNSLGGNVGIGTASPQFNLEVVGSGALLRNTSAASYSSLKLYNDLNVSFRALEVDYMGSGYSGGEQGLITTTGPAPLNLGTSNLTRFTILSNGNIGIGTVTPATKLELVSTGTNGAIIRNTTASAYSNLKLYNDQNLSTRALEIDYMGSTYSSGEQGYIATTGSYPLSFGTNNLTRLTVASTGFIGIGTGAPQLNLEVVGTGPVEGALIRNTSASGYSTLKLYNNSNLDTRSLEIDYMGSTYSGGEQGSIETTGSYPLNLGTAGSARVTISSAGNVGVGTTAPSQLLDVNGNARFRSVGSGTFAYNLNIAADGTLTTSTSDVRMKDNILQITNAIDLVTKLRGVTFTWKNDATKTRQIGMIAQEVEQVVPEVVFTNPVDGLKGINYSQTTALLVEAIKDQQQQIEAAKQENQILKSELNELKALVNSLVANQSGQGNK